MGLGREQFNLIQSVLPKIKKFIEIKDKVLACGVEK